MRALALFLLVGCGVPDMPCSAMLASSTAPGSTTPAMTACSTTATASTFGIDVGDATIGIAWTGPARRGTVSSDDPGVTMAGTIDRDAERWLANSGRLVVTFVAESSSAAPEDNAHGVVDAMFAPIAPAAGTFTLHASF